MASLCPGAYRATPSMGHLMASLCPRGLPSYPPQYILMGQIYQKRMTLPAAMQHIVGGRFGAGDGIIRSSSYVQRYNRRRGRNVLAASHSKCT
uniref:Uncharacterized protein n=1 Tax=Xenopus tropicalis TaxID=8364 RepID=A0A1B8Y280_XENTR